MHCTGSSVGSKRQIRGSARCASVSGLSRVHRPGATGRLEEGSGRTAWVHASRQGLARGRDFRKMVGWRMNDIRIASSA